MLIINSLSGPTIRNKKSSDSSCIVSLDQIKIQDSYEIYEQIISGDAIYNRSVPAIFHYEGVLTISNAIGVELINFTPEICSLSEDGYISRISEGIARIGISSLGVTKSAILNMANSTESKPVTYYVSPVTGSLAEHISQQIDSRINNSMNIENNAKIFLVQNHAASNYVRNPSVWCSGINLTCISPWNSFDSNKRAGTLITKRHIINAAHYELAIGSTVRFITVDDQIVDRVIIGKQRHPDYVPYYPDFTVYTLDSDVPDTIIPCKLFPRNWKNYLVDTRISLPAAFGIDQEEKAILRDLYNNNLYSTFLYPKDATRSLLFETVIVGDSGNPVFVVINDELVLVTVWTMGGAGSGTALSDFIDDINQMIADSDAQAGVSTGYTVTEADFSAFPDYS